MNNGETIFDKLLRRRVLQFVGMYIAATWLVIELGDWVTERFQLPAGLTSYVFIAMLVLLPSIILFAYGHGAPGKDRWTRLERVFIPLNVIAAGFVLLLVDPRVDAEAATQIVQIADETGAIQEFEVARRGYHREVVSFTWTNATGEPELDWLSYGLPSMLAFDIDRISPVISVATPFNSEALRNQLKRQTSPTDIPPSLAVQIARDMRSAALVTGSFDVDGKTYFLSARLVDAYTGEIIGEQEIETTDWLDGVDRMSAALLAILEVMPADDKFDEPIRQHFSDSIDAIRHYTEGEVAISFDNDYPTGIAGFTKAVQLDPQFAEARGALSVSHYLMGNLESAREEATRALRDGYRLSDSSKFALKAQRYIYDGDFERGQRVLDIWTEVQPNSPRAYFSQARLLRVLGGQQALDKAQRAYDRLLELNPTNIGVYNSKAEVELQRGDYASAAAYFEQYLEIDPDSGDARLGLASVYQAAGDLDRAQQVLEYAAVLLDDPVEPGLALALLQARRGESETAISRLDDLLEIADAPQQRLQILTARLEILASVGRIREALDTQEKVSELARAVMPPMTRLFVVETRKAGMLSLIGQTDEAIVILDGIMQMLQPPQSYFMNFVYSGIYGTAEERDAFREWASKSYARKDQFPAPLQPLVLLEQAQIAAWDGRHDDTIRLSDEASRLVSASFILLTESELSVFDMNVGIATLYLEAGAPARAREKLLEILKVYPGNTKAKLVLAKTFLVLGNPEQARQQLIEVNAAFARADEGFIYARKARALLDQLNDDPGS